MHKSTEKAMQKANFVRQMFTKNPLVTTDVVHAELIKVFGKGVAPTLIAKLREEFGIRYGTRGIVYDLKGNRLDQAPAVSTAPVSAPSALTQEIRKIANSKGFVVATPTLGQPHPMPAIVGAPTQATIAQLVHLLREEMTRQSIGMLEIPATGEVTYQQQVKRTLA